MTKANYTLPTSIDQAEIIPFPSPEKLKKNYVWLKQATRLHKDGHKKFRTVCLIAQEFAKEIDSKNQWDELMRDMEFLKEDPSWFDYAVEAIGEAYKKAYADAEILPMGVTHG